MNAPVSSCAASSSSAPAAPLLQIHNNQLYKTTTGLIQQPALKTTTTGLHVETSTCYNQNIFTARKRSLRRLCFYTCLSVILFTGGHAWWQGVACVTGGMWAEGCVVGGMHAWWGCVYATHPPSTLRDTVGQCAGGTHPTGMHSFHEWNYLL